MTNGKHPATKVVSRKPHGVKSAAIAGKKPVAARTLTKGIKSAVRAN